MKGRWILDKNVLKTSRSINSITVSPSGDISISHERGIEVHSSSGEVKFKLDTESPYFMAITVSADGMTYFMTNGTPFVTLYDVHGKYKRHWASPNSESNTTLYGLAMNAKDQVLVGDVATGVSGTSSIHTHEQDGSHINTVTIPLTPHHLGATSKDTIIVCGFYDKSCPLIINKKGEILHTLKHPTAIFYCIISCYKDIILVTFRDKLHTYHAACYSESGAHLGNIPIYNVPCIALTGNGREAIVSTDSGYSTYKLKA